jgi:hypothetical protein
MPSNAAGEWHKFDAEDKATWPEKPGWYLTWDGAGFNAYWEGDRWSGVWVVKFYAEILPPESSETAKRLRREIKSK